jgi:putative inorganic carbon (HCO3(-)) transporter
MIANTQDTDLQSTKLAFRLYMLYMLSFFLRLPSRLPVLGALRIDLILVASIFLLIIIAKVEGQEKSSISKYILTLFIYSIVVLPFTTWPGTVLSSGIPEFIKAAIFFVFTYKLILNEQRLKVMVYIFIFANTFRVIEPLYLNITQGYWGSETSFGWDQVNRLAGGPADTINSNGLAFVIASILPFYHYLFSSGKGLRKIVYWAVLPVLLYAMALTLSRSGLLAIGIIYGVVFLKSKRKLLLMSIGICGLIVFLALLNEVQRDRYLSIFDSDTKSASSAEGRISGWERDLKVAMVKPIFGHGLGTSREANWNIGGNDQPSHNLWLEVFQELGFIGLIIFALYTKQIYKGFKVTSIFIQTNPNVSEFLRTCLPAMQVWLVMNFLFSLASYGLSSYEWYLFGGFSFVMVRLASCESASHKKYNG